MEQVLNNLIYCLNATVPIFLMMALGILFRRADFFDEALAGKLNSFVFKIALPAMLFQDLAESHFLSVWDGPFVLFCLLATLASILISVLFSLPLRERSLRGEFIQSSYRSSVALLGAAFLNNLYGNAGATSLVLIGAVPLYNVAAVSTLALTSPSQSGLDRKALGRTVKGIFTNPILLSIAIGLVWSLLEPPLPTVAEKTLSGIGATATPLGLMALGASFDFRRAVRQWRPTLLGTFLKLVGWAALFLPLAVALGFRDAKLVSLLAMLASPATVSGYVMARGAGHPGDLTASLVLLSTLVSAFTLTVWLYILKTMCLI